VHEGWPTVFTATSAALLAWAPVCYGLRGWRTGGCRHAQVPRPCCCRSDWRPRPSRRRGVGPGHRPERRRSACCDRAASSCRPRVCRRAPERPPAARTRDPWPALRVAARAGRGGPGDAHCRRGPHVSGRRRLPRPACPALRVGICGPRRCQWNRREPVGRLGSCVRCSPSSTLLGLQAPGNAMPPGRSSVSCLAMENT
jgi:hypothetical protein